MHVLILQISGAAVFQPSMPIPPESKRPDGEGVFINYPGSEDQLLIRGKTDAALQLYNSASSHGTLLLLTFMHT